MRIGISLDRVGWIGKVDYRKIILIAFLSRVIFASCYDIFVGLGSEDLLLPDSKFYSARGRYVSALFNGYDKHSMTREMVPPDAESQRVFLDAIKTEGGRFPRYAEESNLFIYIIGVIYFIFGHFPMGVRIFNIVLSITSAYLLFKIARKRFGDQVANIFLLIALFLPTQVGYSITLSRDFIRVFLISLILWVIYG